MAGQRTSKWDVLNGFLEVIVGPHRDRTWSLGHQRQAACDGIWNDLARGLAVGDMKVITDSNQDTSCVFEVPRESASLYISTVLPLFIVWSATERRYLDTCPDWAMPLTGVGFAYVGSSVTRTLSPYRDEESDRRITY